MAEVRIEVPDGSVAHDRDRHRPVGCSYYEGFVTGGLGGESMFCCVHFEKVLAGGFICDCIAGGDEIFTGGAQHCEQLSLITGTYGSHQSEHGFIGIREGLLSAGGLGGERQGGREGKGKNRGASK